MNAVVALERIAFLLERAHVPHYRPRAFRRAAESLGRLPAGELERLAAAGELKALSGVGDTITEVVQEALRGEEPSYLRALEARAAARPDDAAGELCRAMRGDCHVHTNWSDGKSSLEEMALAARDLGHDYVVITDHSPRLTIARGLSPERLRQQLDALAELNQRLAPFRILSGIEVDILPDGSLDQEEELLAALDVVVASVHSHLRSERAAMTDRMLGAIESPHCDVLGHCTGRIVVGRGRKESDFDAEQVFGACARFGKAIEINCRPERLDPPRRLLGLARELGCLFAMDTDAHSPGQLDWQHYGCDRAVACGVAADSVVNTWSPERLLAWTGSHA
ncbi:MAG TPA: PHP domain-containing protein [Polyangiaceae bacterium]|nr:PHP domain-containing protein [Polyangiaceae bacterium]